MPQNANALPEKPDEGPSVPLIRFRDVSYSYPGSEEAALTDLAFTVAPGEIVGLVGATGAGKSTLCLAVNGIVPQFFGGVFYGTAEVAGNDTVVTPTSTMARTVAMVFEDPESQITATTVEGEVAFALENLKFPTEEIVRRVAGALSAVGLEGLETKHPAHLSGGQKQRLSIASALALAPDIIVLDEPTSQLDPVAASEIFSIMERLNREQGLTVLIASHASEELAQIADRVVVLAEGRIAFEGASGAVFSRIDLLMSHHIRPPDVVRSFAVLRRSSAKRSDAPLPVTLEAACEAMDGLALDAFPARSREAAGPPAGGDAVLKAEGLRHVYPDGTLALDGLDLRVDKGEFVGIIGRNGSGKSTLIRHFLKILTPSAGAVRVGAEDVADLKTSELARRIGYVSQNAHQQIFCDTVASEVGFALSMMKMPKEEIDAATERALAAMNLGWAADRHPMSLSRGDRLRVAIAAILALDPPVFIFDEPTTGQDWQGALAIMDMLRELNAMGKTNVLITHHLYLLPGYVDRLVVLDGGRVVTDGALRDVFYDSEALGHAGLVAPQTVRLAERSAALRPLRPLGADDLSAILGLGRDAA